MMGEWRRNDLNQKLEIRNSKPEKSSNEEKTESSKRYFVIFGFFSFELFSDF